MNMNSPRKRHQLILLYSFFDSMRKNIHFVAFSLLILVNQLIFANVNSSVLATGDWYKISITTSGVYKIDKNFLQNLGVNVNSINPKNIQIYGNGGGMLPQSLMTTRYDDLIQNPITVVGEDDGKFDDGDYILFYAQGPHVIEANIAAQEFSHVFNLYSDQSYYFITVGNSPGERISKAIMPNVTNNATSFSTFDEYVYHEKDEYNIIISGREWFGDKLDNFNKSKTILVNTPNIQGDASIEIQTVAKAPSASPKFTLSLNNEELGSHFIAYKPNDYGFKASKKTSYFTKPITNGIAEFKIDYNTNGDTDSKGYINYIGINYKRSLALTESQLIFSAFNTINSTGSKCTITNAANATVWEVTNPVRVEQQTTTNNGNELDLTIGATTVLKKFVVFKPSSLPQPVIVGKIANQNLHGISDSPSLLIVTHPTFIDQANDLADYKNGIGISTKVVTTSQVYNEFSSGCQDVTAIRDLAKMLYDQGDKFRYLLLFGDASYDYKQRIEANTNFVPTYQAYQSINNIETYCSDDYYGFLENDEGAWQEKSSGNHTLEIGIGRFPVQTVENAQVMVNKIKNYHQKELYGNWKNEVTFVADDGDGNLHLDDADDLSRMIKTNYPQYNINKIYLDAFVQSSSSLGEFSPSANDQLNRQIDRGTFIVNYTGHGSETGWTQEQVLTIPQVNAWDNKFLPLFVTATCEFGRYDDPERISGAEYTVLNPNGGAIAIITTTRPVYANSNKQLNTAFYNAIFSPLEDGSMPALGDVMVKTKNASFSGVSNRNFSLLGDPSLVLAYPQKKLVITSVNQEATAESDTIRALELVSMTGEVQHADGSLISSFNGRVDVKIFDKESQLTTYGSDSKDSPTTFNVINSIIYQGKASVEDGKFTFSFVVPKDISYQLGNGKVSLYAVHEDDLLDGVGYKTDLIVGEGAVGIAKDNSSPTIELFMDDRTFENNGKTGSDTRLIADVYDESGLNISSTGIGHEMTLILDNDFNNRYIVNDYYTSNLNEYQSGVIDFPLYELPEGEHSLELKVWDTHNNSSVSTINFYVGDELLLANFPNPFTDETKFIIDHGRAGDPLEIELVIYSSTGQVIRTIKENLDSSPSIIRTIGWDGTDDMGSKIGDGMYIYRLFLRYPLDGKTISAISKLIITY